MLQNPTPNPVPHRQRRLAAILAALGVLLGSFALVEARSGAVVAAQVPPVGQDQSQNPTPSGPAAVAPTSAGDCTVAPVETAHDPTEQAMLAAINAYRQQNSLPPVVASPVLAQAAAWMSHDMAAHGYVSHTDRFGRDPGTRVAECGYASDAWTGENIAAGAGDVTVTLTDWQQSPGHDALLLKPSFRVVGIGRYCASTSRYGCYWTLEAGDAVEAVATAVATLEDAPASLPLEIQADGPSRTARPRNGEIAVVA